MCANEWGELFPLLPFEFVIKSAKEKHNYSSLNKYGSKTIPAVQNHVSAKKEKSEFLPNLYLHLQGTHFPKIAHMSLHLFFFLNQALNTHPDSHGGYPQHSKMAVCSVTGYIHTVDIKDKNFQLWGTRPCSPSPRHRTRALSQLQPWQRMCRTF